MEIEPNNIKKQFDVMKWEILRRKRDGCYENMVRIMNRTKKPFMTDEETAETEKLLLSLKKKHLDVLEWGAGYSTKYFSDFLAKNGITFTWQAIEADVSWYIPIIELDLLPEVRVHLFDEEIFRIDDRRIVERKFDMNEYILFPRKLGFEYDVIIVDGMKRQRCLAEAKHLLKDDGIGIVHDAHRREYQDSYEPYKGKFLLRTLWMGKL